MVEKLLAELNETIWWLEEDLDDIFCLRAAIKSMYWNKGAPAIPWDQALAEIEAHWRGEDSPWLEGECK